EPTVSNENEGTTDDDDEDDMTFKEAFAEAWKELKTVVHPKWSWKLVFESFVWVGILLFALDVATKWIVAEYFNRIEYSVIPLFDWGWIKGNIRLVFNQGMAFGIGDGVLWARILYIIISWNASILIARYWYQGLHKGNKIANVLWMMAWAGAIGNAIDRTFYWEGTVGFSGVIDMFSFTFWGWDFAVFNVADICLCVAIFFAVIYFIYTFIKEARAEKAAE
ncbi:MAG: signal peptidase II, partial [Bacilli bacterium]|nr:signal peptidase II [Bacilli bacterium]